MAGGGGGARDAIDCILLGDLYILLRRKQKHPFA